MQTYGLTGSVGWGPDMAQLGDFMVCEEAAAEVLGVEVSI